MKKYIFVALISFLLASCTFGAKSPAPSEIQKPLPIIPITLSGSTGATSTGFSEDLDQVVEQAFKDANK